MLLNIFRIIFYLYILSLFKKKQTVLTEPTHITNIPVKPTSESEGNYLELKRTCLKEDRTLGELYIEGKYFCDTLEDKYRDLSKEIKIPGKTAIPCGTYVVILTQSNRFKRILPELLTVPNFTSIRIHSGNVPADTEGCILVGKRDKNIVVESRKTETELVSILDGKNNITIKVYIPS